MAQAAKRINAEQPMAPAARSDETAAWSGEVHGPVADMLQAIEASFAPPAADPLAGPPAERPVDALLRLASRAVGWTVLAGGFGAATLLLR